jgi:hypothetical protein
MRQILLLFVFIASLFLVGCEDIFVEDLDGRELNLLAPYDGAILNEPTATFWWSRVDDVTGYRLQVVKPTFDKIEKVLLDSVVTTEKFHLELPEGSFEWRVKAFNSASEIVSDTFGIDVVIVE